MSGDRCPPCGIECFVHMFALLRIGKNVCLPLNSSKICNQLRTHPGIRTITAFARADNPLSTLRRHSLGSVPRTTLRAESPENQFAFANNSLPQGGRGRLGHVVPLHVLNI